MLTGVYGWKCRTIPFITHLRSRFRNTVRMEKAPTNAWASGVLNFGTTNTGSVGDVAPRPGVGRGRGVPPPVKSNNNIGASANQSVGVPAQRKVSFGGTATSKSSLPPCNGAPFFHFGSFEDPVPAERSGPPQPVVLPENLDPVQVLNVKPMASVRNVGEHVDRVDHQTAPPSHKAGPGEVLPPPAQNMQEGSSSPQLSKAPQTQPQSQQPWGANRVAKDAEQAKVSPPSKVDVPEASVVPQVPKAAPSQPWGQNRPGKEKSNDSSFILGDDDFPALGAPSGGKALMPKGQSWRPEAVEPSKEAVVNVVPVVKEVAKPDQRREVESHGSQWTGRERDEKYKFKRGRGGGGNWRDGGEERDPIDSLGRTLTRILRHQAVDLKIKLRNDGYVEVKELLKLHMKTGSGRPMNSHTVEDVLLAVKQDNKQRFGTKEENGVLLIRANQGHTIQTVETEHLLKPILTAEEIPVCVHGTYMKFLSSICKVGLKRMARNHVHFASGLSPNEGAISGMRKTSEILIYLDVSKALKDGMKLYISENGVILTEGFNGIVPPQYFKDVRSWPDNKPINIK